MVGTRWQMQLHERDGWGEGGWEREREREQTRAASPCRTSPQASRERQVQRDSEICGAKPNMLVQRVRVSIEPTLGPQLPGDNTDLNRTRS